MLGMVVCGSWQAYIVGPRLKKRKRLCEEHKALNTVVRLRLPFSGEGALGAYTGALWPGGWRDNQKNKQKENGYKAGHQPGQLSHVHSASSPPPPTLPCLGVLP